MALLTEGTYEATVTGISDTEITFLPPALPAGTYEVIINVEGQGNSDSSLGKLTSSISITHVNPGTGSIHGGQLITITGSGFCDKPGATTVTVGGAECTGATATPASIACVTPAGADGAA